MRGAAAVDEGESGSMFCRGSHISEVGSFDLEIAWFPSAIEVPVLGVVMHQSNTPSSSLFRCKDKKGTFMVETTAWDQAGSTGPSVGSSHGHLSQPQYWNHDRPDSTA